MGDDIIWTIREGGRRMGRDSRECEMDRLRRGGEKVYRLSEGEEREG